MNDQALLHQIEQLRTLCNELQASRRTVVTRHPTHYTRTHRLFAGDAGITLPHENVSRTTTWNEQLAEKVRSLGRAVGARLAVADPEWGPNFAKCIRDASGGGIERANGCLDAAKHLIDAGFLRPARASALVDVFEDLLEQAEYLVEQGFVAPGAVVAGSALEAHLNELFDCASELKEEKRPKKAAATLDALRRVGKLGVADHRQAQALLDLRNAAAHPGHEDHMHIVEDPQRIVEMVRTVRTFIGRHPSG